MKDFRNDKTRLATKEHPIAEIKACCFKIDMEPKIELPVGYNMSKSSKILHKFEFYFGRKLVTGKTENIVILVMCTFNDFHKGVHS